MMKKAKLGLVVCKSEEEAKHITELIQANNSGYKRGYTDAFKDLVAGAALGVAIELLRTKIDWKKVKSRIKARKFKVVSEN